MDKPDKEIIDDLMSTPQGGIRKFCLDGKATRAAGMGGSCGMGLSCELAQEREGQSCQIVQLFNKNPNPVRGECMFWEQRRELTDPNWRPKGADPTQANRVRGQGVRKNRLTGPSHITPGGIILPHAPDLNVSRHIRKGYNIKGDD